MQGSVRDNLDPMGRHSDRELIAVLKSTRLWDILCGVSLSQSKGAAQAVATPQASSSQPPPSQPPRSASRPIQPPSPSVASARAGRSKVATCLHTSPPSLCIRQTSLQLQPHCVDRLCSRFLATSEFRFWHAQSSSQKGGMHWWAACADADIISRLVLKELVLLETSASMQVRLHRRLQVAGRHRPCPGLGSEPGSANPSLRPAPATCHLPNPQQAAWQGTFHLHAAAYTICHRFLNAASI